MQDVLKKLRFKDTATIINAPESLKKSFEKLGQSSSFGKAKSSNTLVFINNKKEFTDFLKKSMGKIEPDSVLWFAYPKGTSKIKTDINRDSLRETAQGFGITTVAAISIDDTWSGLRFRPVEKVGT